MKNKMNYNSLQKPIKILTIAFIILYPLISSFFGIDLGDTGYHLYAFENMFKTPELIGFTSYFSNIVGWGWLKLFSNLGLWGLNFLEVILEWLMVFVIYKTFKSYLGELQTLFGLALAITASDTYLNIFNYHQFNVLLLVLILCFQFLAITREKLIYSMISGICFATVVFSRMGSVTALVTCFVYVFWYFIHDKKISYLLKHFASFLLGVAGTTGVMLLLLKITGQFQYFYNNIFRLSGLASSSDSGYSMDNLLSSFITGNLDAIASGAIFLAAFLVLLFGVSLLFKKTETIKEKVLNILIGIIASGIAIYQMVYAYDVNPIQNWPQMTTGPSFVIGVFYVITFFCLFYHLYGKQRKEEIALISVMSIMLPLLTIAGSNTGTKHVILGLWIIGPIVVYTIGELLINEKVFDGFNEGISKFGVKLYKGAWIVSIGVMVICFGAKFMNMLYYTMNFDSVDRSSLNSKIDSPKVKYLLTTEREADAVNGVLQEIENTGEKEEHPLMVFGGSIMYYYLTEMDSFVQPWFTNSVYSNEALLEDLEKGKEKFDELPIIIYGRTNNYYGFYEFDYEKQVYDETNRTYSGKKDILISFLEENDYNVQYVNDYYVVLYPEDIASADDESYRGYITGDWE